MCSTNSINENSLPQWERALDCAEETMRRISGQCRLQRTGHPDVFCSTLPTHWRSNKSLPTPFVVLAFFPIQDGTKVCISAGNDENYCADVKNNMAEFNGQLARFSDLRFVGKSGRGKNFNLSITIFTQPHSQLIIVPNVVKVTVDGPRDSRNASKYLNGQYIPIPKRIRPGSGLDHLPNQNGANRKNCLENRRCVSNSNSNKINHPITGAPASNFLLSPNPPSANILPPPFLPQTLPMAATLGGLFPRLMNGQLSCKIGGPLPVNLPANIQQNIRMFGIGGFGHNLRMPTLINSSHSNADSIMAQIASARLFGQSAGPIPPINSFTHQIGQSRFSSPILNENLQAAISAAIASSSPNVPPTLPNQSSIFPSPIVPNPINILAVQAMAAGLFGNGQMNADKFGTNTNGIVERNESGERNERNGEELNSKANCEEATATGSSPDEGHCSGEWRGEEEEEGDNNGINQNCDPPINNRKRRSRSEEGGMDGLVERRKLVKYEEEENGRRLAKSGDGNRGNNKMEEEVKPWRLALKDERRDQNVEAHSAAALWRPFHPC